jgi:predicted MFS family arabinose efflux permease
MTHFLARFALLSGNLITGLAVLAPAGMLPELSSGLGVSIREAGFLVTYGAVVLCIASPLVSWLTTRIGRRMLMTGTMVAIAAGHAATAFSDSYAAVLILRLIMMTVVALYTPQAASTISLIVPERERASAISFVFLGWSLAIAVGLPFVTLLANQFGWRETYATIAALAAASALLNVVALPNGLRGHPLSIGSFSTIARSTTLKLMLLFTFLLMVGLFLITIYLIPNLMKLTGAGAAVGGSYFLLFGGAGVVGNTIASGVVSRIGVSRTLQYSMLTVILGAAFWAFGAGSLTAMGIGLLMVGIGLTSVNSMQQARLVAEAPELASATVALNTSVLYVGQAIGSGIGGLLYAQGLYAASGFVALAFFLLAFTTFWLTERKTAAR